MITEPHCIDIEPVAFERLPRSLEHAVPFIEPAFLNRNIEDPILFPVVAARVSGKLRLLVVSFNLIYGFHRQAPHQRLPIGENFAPIHHDAQRLVHPIKFTIFGRHTWKLFKQLFKSCAFVQLKSARVKEYGISVHDKAAHFPGYSRHLQICIRRLQGYVAQAYGILALACEKVAPNSIIAQIFYAQHALT